MKQDFIDEDEQILYRPQKAIKIFLWYVSSLTICFIFIIFAVFLSVSSLNSALNLESFSFFTFTFAGFILFACIYIIFLSDFFFTHTYMTNKKVVITKTFSKKHKEIQFKDIEYCFPFAYTSVCIKQKKKKNYCISFIKTSHILVEKIMEQSSSSINTPTIYKNKISEYMLFIFLNIPFLVLYFALLFNSGHIKSFYYEFMGDKYSPKCYSIAECKNIKKTASYTENIAKANDYYIKALEYAPDNISLYIIIGHNYANLEQYDDAISILNAAFLMNPKNEGDIFYELGCVYEQSKNYDLAIENFKTSLKYDKKGFSYEDYINIHLASVYKKTGQIKLYKQYNEKLKNINLPKPK